MNKNIVSKTIKRWGCFVLLCCSFIACKKNVTDVLPDGQQDIRVSYYAASDVLPETDLNVDISLLHSDTLYQQHQSAFRYISDFNDNVYPNPYQYSDDRQISYAFYAAQPYRFVFSGGNTSLLDTLVALEPVKFHCLYLVDALTAQDAAPKFSFLSVAEPRGGIPEGKIGVRFINLSAEAATLQAVFMPVGGNDRDLSKVAFLQASDYSYFDPKDAENGQLRFKLTDTDGTIIYTAVPAVTGRSYAIIVRGFKTEQRRRMTNGSNVSTITIPNNLRAAVRRTY